VRLVASGRAIRYLKLLPIYSFRALIPARCGDLNLTETAVWAGEQDRGRLPIPAFAKSRNYGIPQLIATLP
jgi:hypothetical protein